MTVRFPLGDHRRAAFSSVTMRSIISLGVFYIIVLIIYLFFEEFIINYRPILISGHLEASYPSSTTLLVLSVMPTLVFQAKRRLKNMVVRRAVSMAAYAFSAFMVTGRLVSGVHWFLLSAGLFLLYKSFCDKGDSSWNSTKNFRN